MSGDWFTRAERQALERFVRTVSRFLTTLAERREAVFLARLTQALARADDLEKAAEQALEVLLAAVDCPGGGILQLRAGRFVPLALRGLPAGQEAAVRAGVPLGRGLVSEVYRENRAIFVEDYPAYPQAIPEFVEAGARAVAAHPVMGAGEARARVMLVLQDTRIRRAWSAETRRFLGVAARVLGLMIAQFRVQERLEALLELERGLLDLSPEEMYARLVRAAVDLVPGAEGGSLLVREGARFHYRAVVGYDLGRLEPIAFSEGEMLEWYGKAKGWREGRPRVLAEEDDADMIERISHRTGLPEVADEAGRLSEIRANLCVPIPYRGAVLAVLNLDAFTDPQAFDAASLQAARAFAVQAAVVLHEAAQRRRLEAAALTDTLTGLQNRRAFNQRMPEELERARRYGHPLALLILDLSGFKRINDELGHAKGDEALVAVARTMQRIRRDGDLLYRWGGDEFAVLMPHTDLRGAIAAAGRYADVICAVEVEGRRLGVNIGAAAYPEDGKGMDALLSVADRRMYAAKAQGLRYLPRSAEEAWEA